MECSSFTEKEHFGSSCRNSKVSKIPEFHHFVVLKEKFEMLTFPYNKAPQFLNLLIMLNSRHRLTSKYHLHVGTRSTANHLGKKELYYYELVMQQDVQATHYVSRCHMLNII